MKYIAILICLFFLSCSTDYERFHEEKNLEITRILCEDQIVVNDEWLVKIFGTNLDTNCRPPIKINVLKDENYEYHPTDVKIQFVDMNNKQYFDCCIVGMVPREKDGTSVNKNSKNRR